MITIRLSAAKILIIWKTQRIELYDGPWSFPGGCEKMLPETFCRPQETSPSPKVVGPYTIDQHARRRERVDVGGWHFQNSPPNKSESHQSRPQKEISSKDEVSPILHDCHQAVDK